MTKARLRTGEESNANFNLPVSATTDIKIGKTADKAESSSNYETIKREINKL